MLKYLPTELCAERSNYQMKLLNKDINILTIVKHIWIVSVENKFEKYLGIEDVIYHFIKCENPRKTIWMDQRKANTIRESERH